MKRRALEKSIKEEINKYSQTGEEKHFILGKKIHQSYLESGGKKQLDSLTSCVKRENSLKHTW